MVDIFPSYFAADAGGFRQVRTGGESLARREVKAEAGRFGKRCGLREPVCGRWLGSVIFRQQDDGFAAVGGGEEVEALSVAVAMGGKDLAGLGCGFGAEPVIFGPRFAGAPAGVEAHGGAEVVRVELRAGRGGDDEAAQAKAF